MFICISAFLLTKPFFLHIPSFLVCIVRWRSGFLHSTGRRGCKSHHNSQSFGGHGPTQDRITRQISFLISVSEAQVTYFGWLALLLFAFHSVLHKMFITFPVAGLAGERRRGIYLLEISVMLAQIDDQLAVRGPGRWRPCSTKRWCWWPSDIFYLLSRIFFFSFFQSFFFSLPWAVIVDFLRFGTTETAENEFRRAGRAYFSMEVVRRIRLMVLWGNLPQRVTTKA